MHNKQIYNNEFELTNNKKSIEYKQKKELKNQLSNRQNIN